MAVYDIIPVTDITDDDIHDTLNAHGGTVSSVSSFFSARANINMFSRRKPVPYSKVFCQDFDSSKPDYDKTWWKGNNGDCGISIPVYTTMDAVRDVTNGTLNGWTLFLPKGGSSEPFRLGDFARYSAIADAPFKKFNIPERVGQGTTVNCLFEYNIVSEGDTSLNLSDFVSLEDCYLGVKIYNTVSGEQYWNTSSLKVKEGANSVSIKIAVNRLDSNWIAFPFLCTKPQPQGEAIQQALYYPLPKMAKESFTVASNVDGLTVTAVFIYNSGASLASGIKYKFMYEAFSSGSTSNNYLYLTKTKQTIPSITDSYYEHNIKLPDFILQNGQKYNYPMDETGEEWAEISALDMNISQVNWVTVSIGNNRMVESVQLIKQSIEQPLD